MSMWIPSGSSSASANLDGYRTTAYLRRAPPLRVRSLFGCDAVNVNVLVTWLISSVDVDKRDGRDEGEVKD